MTPAQQLALWADRLRDMSAMGLYFTDNVYDRANYEEIQTIAMGLMAFANGDDPAAMEPLRAPVFSRPTPISVADAAVFDGDGRLLLIQRADNGQWALPGGALEVGETAATGALREAYEETGVRCELVDLAGVWDSRLCGSLTRHHLYHFVYLAKPLNGRHPDPPVHPQETLNKGWFAENDLPDGIDPGHISRLPHLFAMWRGEARPYFDK